MNGTKDVDKLHNKRCNVNMNVLLQDHLVRQLRRLILQLMPHKSFRISNHVLHQFVEKKKAVDEDDLIDDDDDDGDDEDGDNSARSSNVKKPLSDDEQRTADTVFRVRFFFPTFP